MSGLERLFNRGGLPSMPIPPRAADVEWLVGSTFAPFSETEWQHFAGVWEPLWRVEADQFASTERTTRRLLLARMDDHASLNEVLDHADRCWAVELGNEPDYARDWKRIRAWTLHAVPYLRDHGYGGPILTPSTANLNDDTLRGLQKSLDGVWKDIGAAVHFYDGWQAQIGKLLGVLEGRWWGMTEGGMPQPDAEAEARALSYYADLCRRAYDAGAACAIGYQTHSAPIGQPLGDFGIFRLDGSTRPYEESLRAASCYA